MFFIWVAFPLNTRATGTVISRAIKSSFRRVLSKREASNLRVPTLPEKLLSLVCTPDRLDVVLGDMEQGFAKLAARHGERFARGWYWWQTARSIAWFGLQNLTRLVAARELLKRLGL